MKTFIITGAFLARVTSSLEAQVTAFRAKVNAAQAAAEGTLTEFIGSLSRFKVFESKIIEQMPPSPVIEVLLPSEGAEERAFESSNATLALVKELHDRGIPVPEGHLPEVNTTARNPRLEARGISVAYRGVEGPEAPVFPVENALRIWDQMGSETDPYPLPEGLAVPKAVLASRLIPLFCGVSGTLVEDLKPGTDKKILAAVLKDEEVPLSRFTHIMCASESYFSDQRVNELLALAEKAGIKIPDCRPGSVEAMTASLKAITGNVKGDVTLTRDETRAFLGVPAPRVSVNEAVLLAP